MSISTWTFCCQLHVKQAFHAQADYWCIICINITKFPNYHITFKFLHVGHKVIFNMYTSNFLLSLYNKFNITRYITSLLQIPVQRYSYPRLYRRMDLLPINLQDPRAEHHNGYKIKWLLH